MKQESYCSMCTEEDLIVKLTAWICLDSRQTLEPFPTGEKTPVKPHVNNKSNTLSLGIVNTEQWYNFRWRMSGC